MELYFAYLLSYFTRFSCWFYFACGVAAFNTLSAQITVSLLVGPNGLRESYCLGFFLLSLCADY